MRRVIVIAAIIYGVIYFNTPEDYKELWVRYPEVIVALTTKTLEVDTDKPLVQIQYGDGHCEDVFRLGWLYPDQTIVVYYDQSGNGNDYIVK